MKTLITLSAVALLIAGGLGGLPASLVAGHWDGPILAEYGDGPALDGPDFGHGDGPVLEMAGHGDGPVIGG